MHAPLSNKSEKKVHVERAACMLHYRQSDLLTLYWSLLMPLRIDVKSKRACDAETPRIIVIFVYFCVIHWAGAFRAIGV